MDTRTAYNHWAEQYDSNENKTRDLEAKALREMLAPYSFTDCLEIGCGTGKNSVWLKERTATLIAVDLSEAMLTRAREKINGEGVHFIQADITEPWTFCQGHHFDLIVFSLVLEHIEDLSGVFLKAAAVLRPGGIVYVGELHPFKQYTGSKARFETADGTQVVPCFDHHVSDFTEAARKSGLTIGLLQEYFDEGSDRPRLLNFIFQKEKE